ncbi:MAG: DSD1 family PLP-dependent enzyme [Gammaproteobacteria bacterium]|nr:DSD1 family PLP-dependent enzyme [Gammaproteobacteria bacterium]
MLNYLPTPCLILDETTMAQNLELMKTAAYDRKIDFRPHLKTAKSREVAALCAQEYGTRAMVSTLREVDALRGCGLTDFLYSVAIVPAKFDRLAELLADDCAVTVALDNVDVAIALVSFCQIHEISIPAVIEIDLDGHRSGVGPADATRLCEIGAVLDSAGLLRGVMSHAGASYELSAQDALQACARIEAESTVLAARTLRRAGYSCELVSIGSTPTALLGQSYVGVTELRAGVFMFFDLVQAGVGVCNLEQIALSVLTSVISHNTSSAALIIDAGWMAMSRDRGTAGQVIDYGYGQVCLTDGTILDDIIVAEAQQEHGIIRARKGSGAKLPDLRPGDQLRILPNHACATAAQHDRYHVVNEQGEVAAEWPRFGGW